VLGATTQGPISAVVLMMELTGRDRSFILPMLLVVGIATALFAAATTPSGKQQIYELGRFRGPGFFISCNSRCHFPALAGVQPHVTGISDLVHKGSDQDFL
jgi:hypothetical protein